MLFPGDSLDRRLSEIRAERWNNSSHKERLRGTILEQHGVARRQTRVRAYAVLALFALATLTGASLAATVGLEEIRRWFIYYQVPETQPDGSVRNEWKVDEVIEHKGSTVRRHLDSDKDVRPSRTWQLVIDDTGKKQIKVTGPLGEDASSSVTLYRLDKMGSPTATMVTGPEGKVRDNLLLAPLDDSEHAKSGRRVNVGTDEPSTDGHGKVEASLDVSAYIKINEQGTTGKLVLTLTLAEGWHIYSLTQPEGGPPPTKVVVTESRGIERLGRFRTEQRPEVNPANAVFDVPTELHFGSVKISAPFALSENATAEDVQIRGKVEGLICEASKMCIPIRNLNNRFTAKVVHETTDLSVEERDALLRDEIVSELAAMRELDLTSLDSARAIAAAVDALEKEVVKARKKYRLVHSVFHNDAFEVWCNFTGVQDCPEARLAFERLKAFAERQSGGEIDFAHFPNEQWATILARQERALRRLNRRLGADLYTLHDAHYWNWGNREGREEQHREWARAYVDLLMRNPDHYFIASMAEIWLRRLGRVDAQLRTEFQKAALSVYGHIERHADYFSTAPAVIYALAKRDLDQGQTAQARKRLRRVAEMDDDWYVREARQQLNQMVSLNVGQIAPDFAVKDVYGQPVKLSDLRGKVVLIHFWGSGCGPCKRVYPTLKQLYAELHPAHFAMIGVSQDESMTAMLEFLTKDKGLAAWPQVFDGGIREDRQLSFKYSVSAIPASYLIAPDGKIAARNLEGEELVDTMKSLLP